MDTIKTEICGMLILCPKVFSDERGHFFEAFNRRTLDAIGISQDFVQDNQSRSHRNVLRGLHYQVKRPQGKLVRVISGEIYDVAVDLRRDSLTFGRHVGVPVSSEDQRVLWLPPGLAHGFLVISEYAEVLYKTTDFYAPEFERSIVWNDPDLAIPWPLDGEPILSGKDKRGSPFAEISL